ncbi:helix-turn-helix transcriptional regulator [Enterovibrio norvegicus]|uniref:helix-turn-helix domain-containing protein n=1 Tax=Enterovibrio norvegicus TaxID=188144 RepID=UPI0010BEFF58|nr:helix-turn-helix transcriptional regulator [Enterovibrio norvegicus]TKF13376.1 helix-turn-helix transcriptional regulator [Enterovibrio norvegicus]
MIRYNIKALIEKKSEAEGRKITAAEVARAIGIQKAAMTKLVNNYEYTTTTRTIDALCEYFDCEVQDVITRERSKE